MGISHSEAYAAAGVDIEAGYQGVKMMNRYVQRTLTADVISDLGGFGGLFSLDLHGLEKPVLVSGTDGVQAHTETLWKLLARYRVPTFVFVNKMLSLIHI